MSWKVAYRRAARNDLAALWVDSESRAAITAAANRIDSLLESSPLTVGESRHNDRRILIEAPLAVIYKVKADEGKVVVLRLWRIR